jgi:hypothetical protein
MSKETITAIIGAVAVILKAPIEKLLTKCGDWCLGKFSQRVRIKRQTEIKNRKIDLIIAELGNYYRFNRVSVSAYGDYKLRPTTLENYKKLRITITNEWTSNADKIMQEFKNVLCTDLANGIMKLDLSTTGWIAIPPDEEIDDNIMQMIDVQNLYDVVKSYRFKLGEHVVDGSLALSFTHPSEKQELSLVELRHIRSVAHQLYSIINEDKTKPNNHEPNRKNRNRQFYWPHCVPAIGR